MSSSPTQARPQPPVNWNTQFNFSEAQPSSASGPYSPSLQSPRTGYGGMKTRDNGPANGVGAGPQRPPQRPLRGNRALPPSPLSPIGRRAAAVKDRKLNTYMHSPHSSRAVGLSPLLPTPQTATTTGPSPMTPHTRRSPLPSGAPGHGPGAKQLERRQSMPPTQTGPPAGPSGGVLTSPASPTIHMEILQLRDVLQPFGSAYLNNRSAADVLVQGVPFRRNSLPDTPTNSPSSPSTTTSSSPLRARRKQGERPSTRSKPRPAPINTSSDEIVVQARVYPSKGDRRPVSIQRKFDLDQLRSTIPDPVKTPVVGTPVSAGGRRRMSAVAELSPLSPRRVFSPGGSAGVGGPASPVYRKLIGRERRRSTSARYGPLARSLRSRQGASEGRSFAHVPENAMPIHLEYARAYLPVLAALLLSGHVHDGDLLEVSVPHPSAWPKTVSYVYTGEGELTDAIRENILYLGGKV